MLGTRVAVDWTDQPAAPGLVRTELSWAGEPGTGARIASALRGWDHLRYEVTEEPSPGCDGSRWSHTPRLGTGAGNVGWRHWGRPWVMRTIRLVDRTVRVAFSRNLIHTGVA